MPDASATVVSSTQIAHVSNGASVAAAGFSTTIDTALTSTNMKKWPRCDAVLYVTQASTTATTAMSIPLFRRDINIDGAQDEGIPTSSTQAHFVGSFILPASTAASAVMNINDIQLPATTDCEFYISNALTNLISAGWTLKITPKTDVGSTT